MRGLPFFLFSEKIMHKVQKSKEIKRGARFLHLHDFISGVTNSWLLLHRAWGDRPEIYFILSIFGRIFPIFLFSSFIAEREEIESNGELAMHLLCAIFRAKMK